MAGYRPKSLDELNSIFDKTMAAEKAIKKGTSLLEKGEDSFSSFAAQVPDEFHQELPPQEKQAKEITDSVSDFIARFTVQTRAEPVKAKPQMTVITPEPVKKEYEIAADDSPSESENTPSEEEKSSRDELFDEYMKIMSDEDEESPAEKKLSRKEKKRLRRKEKAAKKLAAEATSEENTAPEEEPVSEEEAAQEEPVISEEVTEQITQEASEQIGEDFTEPSAEEVSEEPIQQEEAASSEEPAQYPSEEGEEEDEFEFPENYTPEWIKENEMLNDLQEEAEEKPGLNFKRIFSNLILGIVLIAVISTGVFATLLKTVVAVNTGKPVAEKYYVFTTYKDYSDLGIAKDTLIITEKKYAGEEELFVYVDYANKTFELGKRTDSITKEDGEVLYVTERDTGRTLVSRDDCKGVVYLTYADRGRIISFLTDNYVIIVAASAVISLAIILLFAFVLRKRKDDEFEFFEEELEEDYEYGEEDFDDIFSSIE